jgi:DNA-binding beta-propeller fold protein YncE
MHPGTGEDEASPQLTCSIINSAGGTTIENVIYLTRDPDYNQVSLLIGLTSGSTTLSPGAIPDPLNKPGPDEGTTIYFDLSMLELSAEVWDGLAFQGQGWTFKKFADQGVVGMTPASVDIPLRAGTDGAVPIGIGGIVLPEAPSNPQAQIYVVYYNIPGVSGYADSVPVTFLRPPHEGDGNLATVLRASVSANGIVNSVGELRAANRFALQFTKLGQLVPAGPDTTFTVGFVYGAPGDDYGYGALTDVTRAREIQVRQGDNAQNWTITPDDNAETVTWTLQPPEGAPIVGGGSQSVVTVNFNNVVTTYQPGPTVMVVAYRQVPGYRDGTFVLLLDKIQHVQIATLKVTPNPTYFRADGAAKVTACWQVAAAQSLQLTRNGMSDTVTGRTDLDVLLQTELTNFELRATGRPGTVENVDYRTAQAVALPVINSFLGRPAEIYHGTRTHEVVFDWAVDSASDVRLFSTGSAFNGGTEPAVGNRSADIREPQMVTLAPKAAGNPLALTRRLVLSAFKPVPVAHQLPFNPRSAAASPAGPFVVLAGPATSLTVVDTVAHQENSTYDLGHVASALVFSADGATLATANTDRTVSILRVDLNAAGLPTFTNLANILLNYVPQQLVFSPNGQRIFLTGDPGGDQDGWVLALVRTADGGYEPEGRPVKVGRGPLGLTLDAAGARLFVANSGGTTVTMIGLTREGKLGATAPHEIDRFPGGPTSVVATPSGRQLLVSCGRANHTNPAVVIIDPGNPEGRDHNAIPLDGTPGQIALLPSGSYAFVTIPERGTIALIDCWGRPGDADMPGPTIPVGTAPAAVTASPDGLQVLVTMAGGVSVVTLATYEASSVRPSIRNRPTNVAVTPDGETVFAWHDALVPTAPPAPGVLVYDTLSRTITNLLASKNILDLVASPDPLGKESFAIVMNDPLLYWFSDETLQTRTYALGLPVGTNPVALAISGDGNAVYVVAANAERDLTLAVVEQRQNVWTIVQRLPLYRMTEPGRILLRSTLDGSSLFLVDVTAAQVRVLRRTGRDYVLSPTKIVGDVRARDLAVLPDGSTAYVLNSGSQTNSITVVDVASLRSHVAAVPQRYVNLTALQSSPDGRRLFAPDANAAAVRVLDPKSLRILQTISLTTGLGDLRGISGIAVAADGSTIYTANRDSLNMSIVDQIRMGIPATDSPRIAGTPSLWIPNGTNTSAAYDGLFLRHYLNERPGMPSDGWSASPDIIPHGEKIEPDVAKFATPAGYAKDWGEAVIFDNDNYLYTRGYNDTDKEITSRVYFYYTRGGLALWPANWTAKGVTVGEQERNWVDVTAPPKGVGVGANPFLWIPEPIPGLADHYCVIAWASDGPDPQPPDLPTFRRFVNHNELVRFIIEHHNLAWRNTNSVVQQPPDQTYATGIDAPAAGLSFTLGITFKNMPLDGRIAINMQGPDSDNSIAISPSPLTQYQGGYNRTEPRLRFPPLFTSSLRVQYWKGATPVPDNAQIQVLLQVPVAPALVRDIERMYRPMGLRTPLRRVSGVPSMVIGSAQFNLLWDKAGN